jgi:hypothetical protein
MRTYRDAKLMAQALRSALEQQHIAISHSQALEVVAAQFECPDWNVLAAKIRAAGAPSTFKQASPILRIFDEDKAKEFYLDFLGFQLDWEHRYGENFPLYAQVSRAGLILHLSGHHGDASPGSNTLVSMRGVRAFEMELSQKRYPYLKPSVEAEEYGAVMTVTDPFSNRIRFCEPKATT